jgi:hypothetical protein
MALSTASVNIGDDWTLLNSSDAATVQIQNTGNAPFELVRGTTTQPTGNVPSIIVPPGFGCSTALIADVVLAPTGGRLWARATDRARATINWV